MMMASLGFADSMIRQRVSTGSSHSEIATELQQAAAMSGQASRGLSTRSIRRYCELNGIHRSSRLSNGELDDVVEEAVSRDGPSYGRRTMRGLLRSEGIFVGEQRVREAMQRTAPVYMERRRVNTYRHMNPVPYYAEYFGHKMHIDQNEKLIRFGVTHVAASDGYSGKILDVITMPIKNPILIYDQLFRYVYNHIFYQCSIDTDIILLVLLVNKKPPDIRIVYQSTHAVSVCKRHFGLGKITLHQSVNYSGSSTCTV